MFGLLVLVTLGSVWLFGAWETWWFWPFTACLFAAGACFGLRLVISGQLGLHRPTISPFAYLVIAAWLPFLAYAVIRTVQTEVRMDAERSLLLQTTPLLIAGMVAVGLSERRQRALLMLILVNLGLIGLYGIANHTMTGNAKVLWLPGYPQYQEVYHRALGTYFCPDHFSGLMELALAGALTVLLVRSVPSRGRLCGLLLAVIALWGIALSRSRGGGLVACFLILGAIWLAGQSWPRRSRWLVRGIGLAVLAIALTGVALFGGHYTQRFKEYPWASLKQSDRYMMTAGALRGWASAPWFGIGPGMHPNLWPHFAATSDGDRATGRWPSALNNTFHSFEAHDDWAQLLEEYGGVGFLLFLTAVGTLLIGLYRRWKHAATLLSQSESLPESTGTIGVLTALLAALAMVIHSVGDFNLQIPGTVWTLGALGGLAVAAAGTITPSRRRRRRHRSESNPLSPSTPPTP